jgi:hypothetical protein
MPEPDRIVAVTSILHYIVGIGFSLGTVPFSVYVFVNRRLPEFLGIRFFGDGFIERQAGVSGIMWSSLGSIVTTAVYILAGYWLGKSMKLGGALSLALFPVSMFFALGYNAPAPILVHPVLAILILVAWRHLR